MIRYPSTIVLCVLLVLVVSCSKRERSDPNAEEWNNIEALANDAKVVPAGDQPEAIPADKPAPTGEFAEFIKRLEQMKDVQRKPGETLLTGKTLVFDYDKRLVRMDEQVNVVDDHGVLETASLIGRFSVSNEVEYIEAKDGVILTSDNRNAEAETAVYDYLNGVVQLEGLASISENGNRLSGERIRFWIKGTRKMVCEPNALLQISGATGEGMEGLSNRQLDTEIRADLLTYDESLRLAELKGNVRLRDARAAMNCGEAHVFLKEDNKIDWIEALCEVIIQSDDRKALADRATYHADEGKFTLEGDPKVMQGINIMTGDRITFWYETRGMVCEPNARFLLYVDEETKAKFLKDLND